jgi:GT2 family glycosyltransferase
MKNPKVSVIVLSMNGLEYLAQTVPTLVNQKIDNVEYIYILNGSTDGSSEYLRRYKVKVIENETNLGISVAKNRGAQLAKGEYLFMVDEDMLFESDDFLSGLVRFYEELENPAFVQPLFVDKEDLKERTTRAYGTYYNRFGINRKLREAYPFEQISRINEPIPIPIAQGGAMFIKKSVWNELGGFDTSQMFNLDDDDVSTRAFVYGYKNYLYNKDYIVHLGFSRRLDKSRYAWNDKTYFSGKMKALLKNFEFKNLLWILPLSAFRMIAEAFYHTYYYKHLPILWANISSMINAFVTLPDTIQKRRVIQRNRKAFDDSFLQLTPPDYANV